MPELFPLADVDAQYLYLHHLPPLSTSLRDSVQHLSQSFLRLGRLMISTARYTLSGGGKSCEPKYNEFTRYPPTRTEAGGYLCVLQQHAAARTGHGRDHDQTKSAHMALFG